MEFDHKENKLKNDELKLYVFWVLPAIALIFDNWYEHNKYAGVIRLSIGLICFGFTNWIFNEVMILKINKTIVRTPKFLRFLAVSPNPEVLKTLGISSFGLGCIMLICCFL